MRIGVDLRAMQVGHQLRGIGEVLRQACVQLDRRLPATDAFVGFHDPPGPPVGPVLQRVLPSGRPATTVDMPPAAGRLGRVRDNLSPEQVATMGEACDVLLQFDFQLGVPSSVPTVLVVHDQIPLVLGDRYPATYWPHYGAARRAGLGHRVAAERALRRKVYERNLANGLRRAAHVVANSAHTARTTLDFAHEHGVSDLDDRLQVALLGHEPPSEVAPLNVMERDRVEALGLDRTPYLLYVGGVDDRRRVDLLVAAFNELRARGRELGLVLAGDSFATVSGIGVERTRQAVATSSYRHDIHLLGFVSEAERAWLYGRAAAVAFPSEHEGFGLPVIEALAVGAPVVAFEGTAVDEVCGPNGELVAPGWRPLADGLDRVLARPSDERERLAAAGRAWAAGFTWDALGAALAGHVEAHRPT
ncbi:MAG TPA: glycosyltransferase [Aquihabitans sp.]|jgi:glycosyltransferase involved in cell wall biosynthesis|nr:glycosyltransferase [Aquihabitans sp.]